MSNQKYVFELNSGEIVPVIVETRKGMRNIIIKPKLYSDRLIMVSKPWFVSVAAALNFVKNKRDWLNNIFNNAVKRVRIQDGDVIEFLDRKVCVIHDDKIKSNKYLNSDHTLLAIGGSYDMFEHRILNVVKAELLVEIKNIINTVPKDLKPKRIVLRDTSSRWGSCSIDGNMSFSWRLAFAPKSVLRYVVIHELAHRRHMDHSEAFWKTVSDLYGFGMFKTKNWLVKNGQILHKYF